MQRFFLNPQNFQENSLKIGDPDVIHQMNRVLRVKPGDEFIAINNESSGTEYICKIQNIYEGSATATIIEKRKNTAEPDLFITLYQALPKKIELFEWVLQKGTEVGISAFLPLITERTERESAPKKERFQKILKEAAEQSGRGKIPELKEPVSFEKLLRESQAADTGAHSSAHRIIFHTGANYPLLSSQLDTIKKSNACSIFIGPEGGFSEKEIAEAKEKGFAVLSLGPRTFRTETAGIVASALLLL